MTVHEGDVVLLKVKVARANEQQALIEIASMEGPYSLRVPIESIFAVVAAPVEA
jgi:hypothetical protein